MNKSNKCHHSKVRLGLFGCNILCLDCDNYISIDELKPDVKILKEDVDEVGWFYDDSMTFDELKEYIEAQPCEKSCKHCSADRTCNINIQYCCGRVCKEYC